MFGRGQVLIRSEWLLLLCRHGRWNSLVSLTVLRLMISSEAWKEEEAVEAKADFIISKEHG